MHGGAADDMAGIGPHDLDVFVDGVPGIVVDADEMVHAAFGVLVGVQRLEVRLAFGFTTFVGIFYFVLLNTGGILEQHLRERLCGGGAEYLAIETVFDELRDKAAVIDVGMGEDEVSDLRGYETPITVEHIRFIAHPLEHTAVEQKSFTVVE